MPLIKEKLEPLGANIVICDLVGYVFADVADQLGLPTIIYSPYSIEGYQMVTGYMIPTADTMCTCCGILCIRPTCVKFMFDH